MKPTFEQMKGAAIDVRRKFFRGCSGAFYNIIECNSERELRFLTIRYCEDISRKYISDYIRGNYERMFWKHLACGSSYTTTAACGCI